jgi:hypothetical protein
MQTFLFDVDGVTFRILNPMITSVVTVSQSAARCMEVLV